MAENAQEKEIEELLSRFEKTDSFDDFEFLASNLQILSGISNPKFADRIHAIRSRVEQFCKTQAEAALAGNGALSQNPDYPEALQYAEYSEILTSSDVQENQELGQKLAEKAKQELSPYTENYERLNDQIKPITEIDSNDQILVGFLKSSILNAP